MITVTGTVYDTDYGALKNANVSLVTLNKGFYSEINTVQTNTRGEFSINVPGNDSQIKFSYVGYDFDVLTAQEIIKNNSIVLYPQSTQTLPEAVVPNPKAKPESDNSMLYLLLVALGLGGVYLYNKKNKVQPVKMKA